MALRVTYRTALDGELRAYMTTQLVKYLLFMRGQIPCLYDELLRFVESYQEQVGEQRVRRRLPMSGGIKKAVKCVEAAELLFSTQLKAIFLLQVQRVALIFGSSMMSSREAVVVDFDNENEGEGGSLLQSSTTSPQTDEEDMSMEDSQTMTPPTPPMPREKLMRLCAQKLMRTLFTHSMEQFASALPATKLHIAVLAKRQSTRVPGFIPKQQFKLRLPKDKRGARTHYVTICGGVENTRSQEDLLQHSSESQLSSDISDMIWYVLEKPISGFSEAIATREE